jgi:PAS domain S-box-containing protein
MTGIFSNEVENIVNNLLIFVDRVVAIADNYSVHQVWDREDDSAIEGSDIRGLNIAELTGMKGERQLGNLIGDAFSKNKKGYLEYSIISNNSVVLFGLRVLPIHPEKEFIFITIENLSPKGDLFSEQDRLIKALQATGDGVWDINFAEDVVCFTGNWEKIFGYEPDMKMTISEWRAHIHPEDIGKSSEIRSDFFSGKVPNYSAELRFRCKDGTYKWIWSRGFAITNTHDGKPLRCIGTHTDINDKKIAEDKFTTISNLLSRLINNLNSGILVTDQDHKVIFANGVFCDIYNITGGPTETLGLSMDECFEKSKHFYKHPHQVKFGIEAAIANGKTFLNKEVEMIDGRILSLDHIALSLDENNNGEIWKFTDVTVQKNIDSKFEEQRKFYENILNNIPADIAAFDTDHKYLFVNKNGIKDEELRKWIIGKTDVDYARYRNRPDSFFETRFELYDKAIDSRKSVQLIEKLISKEGKEEYHLRIINPVLTENGNIEFLQAYGLNITDLIVAQESLKTSAEIFSSAFDYSGIGMALVGLDGKWLDVNTSFCLMTGYSKDELLALTFQEITYPDDLESDLALIRRMLKKELKTYTLEKRYISKDKKIVLVLLTVSLVWNTDGTPKFFIAQVVDITQKKELENEIRRKNNILEASKESLQNKVNQLEDLNHIIAHNLRGPAGNIKMFSEILMEQLNNNEFAAPELSASGFTYEQALQFIQESSNSLISSLETLMEITQIKLNKTIPNDNCDVQTIINEIITQFQSGIYEKQALIQTERSIEQISYPKVYLENIIYNLLSNSLKYIRPGTTPEILISVRSVDERTVITVKDNGLGINLDKYGDRLFKLNQVFHSGFNSKGIGLYITKTQVESLGGSIEVKSKENEGSEFIVTL